MKKLFNAPPNYTDFLNDAEGSAEKINGWIEKSTNGMIKKMLSAEDVKLFKMALVNAVYFKQNWKKPFNKEITREKEFTNLDGSHANVQMMLAYDYYRAFAGQHEKIIELPYADEKTSMLIVLPDNMQNYQLTNEVYTNLVANLTWQKVNLEVPQFTFETPTFELKGLLQKMGLLLAFEDSADFSGMRTEKDLKIGTALHKAKIIVTESGTEAAAATVIGIVETTSASPQVQPVMVFKTDKPFFYIIRDNTSGAILFMGKMNAML
jgi:serpin B